MGINNNYPVYINGAPCASIPAIDRGLHYGDGLFETLLVYKGKCVLAGLHMQRLFRDCDRLGISINRNALFQETHHFFRRYIDESSIGILKILVTRESVGRGYAADKNAGSNRILIYYPGLSLPSSNRHGIRLTISDKRLPYEGELAGVKHLNRLQQVIARTSLQNNFYQEALVQGQNGEVLEGTSSNVFYAKDDRLYTPCLDKAGVRGVMREYIKTDVAKRLNIPVIEKAVKISDLCAADEIFICNSVFGIWPVTRLNVKQYDIRQFTLALMQELNALGYKDIHA